MKALLNELLTILALFQARGANIYAEFLGGSFTCDAYHMTEPHPEGKLYCCALVTGLRCRSFLVPYQAELSAFVLTRIAAR